MTVSPSQFPPPFDPESVIAKSVLSADKQLPVGVLIVGAGPAGLACAIRLMQLLEKETELKASLGDFPVAVLEKGKYPGAHLLSGAVINPVAFRKLFPNLKDSDFPFYGPVDKE
ncbi:MAG: NAD(P)-binding protein [Deltaproteobacteria bacterium]|nr:NAD(P)-binding protein [Deltaproteobacteria bacterium]